MSNVIVFENDAIVVLAPGIEEVRIRNMRIKLRVGPGVFSRGRFLNTLIRKSNSVGSFGAACHSADEERGGWGGLAQGRWEGASWPRPG
eukprot:146307-Rhodomonas_salina.1